MCQSKCASVKVTRVTGVISHRQVTRCSHTERRAACSIESTGAIFCLLLSLHLCHMWHEDELRAQRNRSQCSKCLTSERTDHEFILQCNPWHFSHCLSMFLLPLCLVRCSMDRKVGMTRRFLCTASLTRTIVSKDTVYSGLGEVKEEREENGEILGSSDRQDRDWVTRSEREKWSESR